MPALIPLLFFGLALSLAINLLADILPGYRWRADEEGTNDIPLGGSEESVSDTSVDKAEPSAPAWSVSRLISARYIAITLLMLALTAYLSQAPLRVPLASALIYLSLFALIAIIDIEHRLILTVVMIPAFLFAFVELALTRRLSFPDAMVGYALGQILVMGIYLFSGVFLWFRNIGQDEPIREIAFGFGDVTLATFCGLVLGYPSILYMIVLMILLGGAIGLLYLIVRLLIVRRYEASMVMPYGPAIVLAAAIMLLWGDRVAFYAMGGR